MNWEDFDLSEFYQRCGDKIGLVSNVSNDDADEHPVEFLVNGKKEKGVAVTAIPFIPNANCVVIMTVWKTSLLTLLNEDSLRKQEPSYKVVVAKGGNVNNVELGDVVEVSLHTSLHLVSIKQNSLALKKIIDLHKTTPSIIDAPGKKKVNNPAEKLKNIYGVEFFSVPSHNIEGIHVLEDE